MSSIGFRPFDDFLRRLGGTQEPAAPPAAPGATPSAEGQGGAPARGPDADSAEFARVAFGSDPLANRLARATSTSGRPAAPAAGTAGATGTQSGAPAAERPLLKYGSRGQDVKDLQEALNAFRSKLGLSSIGTEGTFGPSTQRAVTQFQRANGLEADGVAGANTWKKLLGEKPEAPAAKAGSTTARVLEQRDAIEGAAAKYGVPPALIAAIMEVESGGKADIIGKSGPTRDVGLMQINPKAHPKYFEGNDTPTDPAKNVEYGTSLLRDNLKAFSGDLDKTIAAYNAGVSAVRSASKEGKDPRTVTYHDNYVDKVLANVKKYSSYF